MTDTPQALKGLKDFYFSMPLYEVRSATVDQIKLFLSQSMNMDGFCPFCRRASTFFKPSAGTRNYPDAYFLGLHELTEQELSCARNKSGHTITFYSLLSKGTLQKIGQYPSFADIALDESKDYSKLLDKEDTSEFHKAIGLAAHGVGIGSYVYLRRIFERLIAKRFAEYRDAEGWDDASFKAMRMKERIEHLKDHLPEFLVSNAKLYSILSLGVHELDEADCLAFFPILRQSTIWILEQDKKKQEELAQRKQLEAAIAKFAKPAGDMTLANLAATMPDQDPPS